jgi:hypothetical protein
MADLGRQLEGARRTIERIAAGRAEDLLVAAPGFPDRQRTAVPLLSGIAGHAGPQVPRGRGDVVDLPVVGPGLEFVAVARITETGGHVFRHDARDFQLGLFDSGLRLDGFRGRSLLVAGGEQQQRSGQQRRAQRRE